MTRSFNSFVFRVESPDGNAYIQILESKPGEIEHIIMHIGKAGSSVNAWCQGVADLTALAIKNDVPVSQIIATLQGISSAKPRRVLKGGYDVRSGPEALAIALIKYRAASEPIIVENYDEFYRPAKFTNPRKSA